jgi:tetratricopeptide (TPR) repeat protein
MTSLLTAAALAALLSAAPARPAEAHLPFVEGDYARALADAKARAVPLVAEIWAPWCPTCRFMRAAVWPDARLLKLAPRFAWLDVDTEQPRNFAFVDKFPIEAWPTVLVIDPADEHVLLRWMGTASAAELEKLLADADRTFHKERTDAAGAALARGAALAAERKHKEAAQAFGEALAAGGPRWPERARTADALLQALSVAGDPQACAGAATELLPTLEKGPAFARVAAAGLGCANEIEVPATREPAIRALEPSARLALGLPGVLTDDRSWLHEQLLGARQALGDEAGVKRAAREWLAFVEDESRRARTPLARSALDGARVSAAMALGEPKRILKALRESARALPDQYFAQSYLAMVALEAGEPKEALEAARRGAALAEGARKVRLLTLQAQAQHALGDDEAARATAREAIAFGEGLPEAVRPGGLVRRARKVLEQLSPPEAPPADGAGSTGL